MKLWQAEIKLKYVIGLMLGVILIVVGTMLLINPPQDNGVLVTRVIDGDTIEIEGGERVRYLGIDTPEVKEHFGSEALKKNQELVEGRRVYLEKDTENRDKYGRLLRYVWIGNTMVNGELVRIGYARSYSYLPNVKYQVYFLQLEIQARDQHLGMWVKPTEPYTGGSGITDEMLDEALKGLK